LLSFFSHYERIKREFKSTAASCESANFDFVPAIVEAHAGGLSPAVRALSYWIYRGAASWQQEPLSAISLKTAQRMSVALHRENARAVLKRMPVVGPAASGGDVWENTGDMWQ
jgi:hypothetical protein